MVLVTRVMFVHRKTTVSMLTLVLYGGTMLLGQGLHELLGCGHSHGPQAECHANDHVDSSPHESKCRHAPECCHSRSEHSPANQPQHCHTHAGVSVNDREPQRCPAGFAAAETDGHDQANCPICQFHGQGQLGIYVEPLGEGELRPPSFSCQAHLVFARSTAGIPAPRGPPA